MTRPDDRLPPDAAVGRERGAGDAKSRAEHRVPARSMGSMGGAVAGSVVAAPEGPGGETGRHLDWPSIVRAVHDRLVSPLSKSRHDAGDEGDRAVALLPRYDSVERVQQALLELDGCACVLQRDANAPRTSGSPAVSVLGTLAEVEEFGVALSRAERAATLAIEEVACIAAGCRASSALADALAPAAEGQPERELERLDALAWTAIRHALDGLEPLHALAQELTCAVEWGPDGPTLSDAASPALARARARAREHRQALIRRAQKMLKQVEFEPMLADDYFTERDGRIVLPVRASAYDRRGRGTGVTGVLHGASATGQTVFVEPEALMHDNNALHEAIIAVRREEVRVLEHLTRLVGERTHALRTNLDVLERFDVIHARLEVSRAVQGKAATVVDLTDDVVLELVDARHPGMVLDGRRDVIANDIVLARGTALVISGPNAGGKTVALKTAGLCLWMTQAGLRIPCARAVVPMFRRVITDVGDDQSIARNLSTFTAHMRNVVAACDAVERDALGTLLLFDELASGTDPEQGAALAASILDGWITAGASAIVTTHDLRLKLLAANDPVHYTNAAVGIDPATLSPTFRLHLGVPGSSSAFVVARRMGVPEAIVRSAEAQAPKTAREIEALLQSLQEEREALRRGREALTLAHSECERLRRELDERETALELAAEQGKIRALEQAQAELLELRRELRARRKLLSKANKQELVEAWDQVERDSAALQSHRPTATEAEPASLRVGDRVHLPTLNVEGEVVAMQGTRIVVQTRMAKLEVDRGAVSFRSPDKRKPGRGGGPVANTAGRAGVREELEAGRHFGAEARPVEARFDNVIDVRGMRAEEALSLLESMLSRAIEQDETLVIVRHGAGSGALRKAVREHLPRLAYVRRHRAGLAQEGGENVTVVWVQA